MQSEKSVQRLRKLLNVNEQIQMLQTCKFAPSQRQLKFRVDFLKRLGESTNQRSEWVYIDEIREAGTKEFFGMFIFALRLDYQLLNGSWLTNHQLSSSQTKKTEANCWTEKPKCYRVHI